MRKLGKGHCDAQAFVAKELPEPSLPPPSSGSRSVSCHLRSCPHKGTKGSPEQNACNLHEPRVLDCCCCCCCSDFQARTAMELHGSGLRVGVHFYVENEEIRAEARHLSLHIFGHVNNLPDNQELHLWIFDGFLLHNRNVRHSEDGLNLGHLGFEPLNCRNLSLLITGTSTTNTVFCTVCTTARTLSVRN